MTPPTTRSRRPRARSCTRGSRTGSREAGGSLGERDEIVGYHLEQAYRYRTELGPLDDRARELGRRAGEHLGDAGLHAFARDDMSASAGLLDRAVRVLPSDHQRLPAFEDRLVASFIRSDDLERATEANARHIRDARSLGDRAQEQRAELGAQELRATRSPQDVTADEVRRIAHRAIEVFEEVGDEEGLSNGHLFLSASAVQSGRASEALTQAELSLDHALRSGARIPLWDAPNDISSALYRGPTPAGAMLERLERLADQMAGYRSAEAAAKSNVAWCLSHLGRFDEARAAARHQLVTFEELDNRLGVAGIAGLLSLIELFAGDPPAAEEGFRELCDFSRDVGNHWILVNAVLDLAELLVVLGRDEEVLEQTNEILSLIAPDEFWLQARWRAVRSVPLARLGHVGEALTLIEEAERLARSTDFIVQIADTMRSKAEVLKIANRRDDAVARRSRGPRAVRDQGVHPPHRLDPSAARLAHPVGPRVYHRFLSVAGLFVQVRGHLGPPIS